MLEVVLFHHHSSIQDEGWSKVGFGRLCSNPRLVYYFHSKVNVMALDAGRISKVVCPCIGTLHIAHCTVYTV